MSQETDVPSQPPADPDALLGWFERMRAAGPVSNQPQLGGWQVFGYAEALRALSDHASFSSDFSKVIPPNPDFDLFNRGNFAGMDPPRHRELRSLVGQAFTPRLMAGLSGRILELTHDMLRAGTEENPYELVSELAYPLPVTVIVELLGLPTQDWERFRYWADALLAVFGRASVGVIDNDYQQGAGPLLRELSNYMLDRIRERRVAPGEDLISKLTQTEIDGVGLADEDIVGFVSALLMAGHITSTILIGNIVLCLDENPGALTELRGNRDLVPAAIEEVLRFRAPFGRIGRLTTKDTDLGTETIPAGQPVTIWLASANRDERRFDRPNEFDVHRPSADHLSFGHGIHFCLGSYLGRLEGEIVLNALLDRFADLRVDRAGVELHDPRAVQGPKRLPLVMS